MASGTSNGFGIEVGIHQGSVSRRLLFILLKEEATNESRVGDPWELLYADELVRLGCGGFVQGMVMAVNWRGLKVNWKKTKLLVTGGEAGEAV